MLELEENKALCMSKLARHRVNNSDMFKTVLTSSSPSSALRKIVSIEAKQCQDTAFLHQM